jgi:serine/threonine-protein kinase RsbW
MGDRDEPRAGPVDRGRTHLTSIQGGKQGSRGDGRTPPSRRTEELTVPARTASARVARHWVMNQLAAEGVYGLENQVIELLTGELVANAALHGPSDGEVRVRAWRAGDTVRVAVRDSSPTAPVVRHAEPTAASGRGMALVESLAADWGVEHHGDEGKTVWFDVALEQE